MPADVSQLMNLAADIQKADGHVGREAANVVRATTKTVETTARGLVPVDSGALQASISSRVSGSGSHGSITGTVEAEQFYSQFVEFGTARMAPQPFMTPALEQHTDAFYRDTEAAAAAAIEKALP